MSKTWAEMTDQERWEHSQRHGTDWHRNNPNPSASLTDFVNQQADSITVTQPSDFLQAMAGEDVVENRLYTSDPALDPKSNYAETQAAAQNIQNSGFSGNDGSHYYNTGNPDLNAALYGDTVANNLSYDGSGWEIPRHLQDNQAVDIVQALAGTIATAGLTGGGLFGALGQVAQGGANAATVGDIIYNLNDIYQDVTEDDDQGPPDFAWQLPDISDQIGDVQVQIPDFQTPDEGGGGGDAGSPTDSGSQAPATTPDTGGPQSEPNDEMGEGELTTGGLINPWEGWDITTDPDFVYVEDDIYTGNDDESQDGTLGSITITTNSGGSTGAAPYFGTGIYGESVADWANGPSQNGMGPDGTQAGAGSGSGAGGGTGGGSGGGDGNGNGDGSGEGDGDGNGSGNTSQAANGGVSDAEWTELFPYTKLTPAQKTRLLPHIDYIRSIRG